MSNLPPSSREGVFKLIRGYRTLLSSAELRRTHGAGGAGGKKNENERDRRTEHDDDKRDG